MKRNDCRATGLAIKKLKTAGLIALLATGLPLFIAEHSAAAPIEMDHGTSLQGNRMPAPRELEFDFHLDGELQIEGAATSAKKELSEAFERLREGKVDTAIALASDLLKRVPRYAAAHEILGAALAIRGDVVSALASLNKAVQLEPQRATAYTKIGDIYLALNKNTEAREYFERAIEHAPNERRAHQRLGLLSERQGQNERAISHYEKGIVGTPPDYVGIKVNLGHLYNTTGRHQRTLELLEAWQNEEQRQPEMPRLSEVHTVLGDAFHGLKKYPEAIHSYQAALTARPEAVGIKTRLAWSLLANRDYAVAATILDDLAKRPDAAAAIFSSLGEARERVDNMTAAQLAYEQMVARYPKQKLGYQRLSLLLGATKKYADALEVFDKGLRLFPDDIILMRGKRTAYQRLGKFAEAIRVARRIVTLQPEDGSALFYLASLQKEAGQLEEAIGSYQSIVEKYPTHVASLNNLAVALTEAGKPDQALVYAREAAKTNPDESSISDTLGWTLFRSGKQKAGIAALKRAHTLSPTSPAPLYHLGLAYLEQKNPGRAQDFLKRALKHLEPHSAMAKDVKRLLMNIK